MREHVALGVDVRQSLPAFVAFAFARLQLVTRRSKLIAKRPRAHELLLQTKHLIAKSLFRRAKTVHRVALRLDAHDELGAFLSRLFQFSSQRELLIRLLVDDGLRGGVRPRVFARFHFERAQSFARLGQLLLELHRTFVSEHSLPPSRLVLTHQQTDIRVPFRRALAQFPPRAM